MVRCVVHIADGRRLAVLRACRSVHVEAVQPDASAVEHFACVVFVSGFGSHGEVEVKVGCRAIGKDQSQRRPQVKELLQRTEWPSRDKANYVAAPTS